MAVEEYFRFKRDLGRAHDRYIGERSHAYSVFHTMCKDEQAERDRKLAAVDPKDIEAIKGIREEYDKKVRRAAHIYEGYESRAWVTYQNERNVAAFEQGMTSPHLKELRAVMMKALFAK